MQAIYILRDQCDGRGPIGFQPGQGKMRCIGLDRRIKQLRAPRIVKSLHQIRIAREGLGRCHILDPVARPDAIGIAKGSQAGFARNPRAGQDNNGWRHQLVGGAVGVQLCGGRGKGWSGRGGAGLSLCCGTGMVGASRQGPSASRASIISMATSFDEHSINQGIAAMAGLAAWRYSVVCSVMVIVFMIRSVSDRIFRMR
jgi:hypothetical protein